VLEELTTTITATQQPKKEIDNTKPPFFPSLTPSQHCFPSTPNNASKNNLLNDHFAVMQIKLSASAIQSNCVKSPAKSVFDSNEAYWSSELQRFLGGSVSDVEEEGREDSCRELTASKDTRSGRRGGRRGLCLCCEINVRSGKRACVSQLGMYGLIV
jgi:hypothetical protein